MIISTHFLLWRFFTHLISLQRYEKYSIYTIVGKKNNFFCDFVWSIQKKVVPLHPE